MTKPAETLCAVLRDPQRALDLNLSEWTALLAVARAEQLIGSLAMRVEGLALPARVADVLADARQSYQYGRVVALWEARCAVAALAPLGIATVLLKGTAYLAAGRDAGEGRSVGDLDIIMPRDRLDEAEAALLAAGWEWVKPDPYDDDYYRRWMHELPPLIHAERDRMIDVHHTILPLTARPTPDAAAMLARAVELGGGLSALAPADMVCHCIAHLIADGDLAGGLRNLWDLDRLVREFAPQDDGFWSELSQRASEHQLMPAVARALRLATALYGTPVDRELAGKARPLDRLFMQRLLARNGWGQETGKGLRLGFYVRSHLLRMPPLMLARHLWIKWRRPKAGIARD